MPVEKIVIKEIPVEVPVEKIVERIKEVPVEKIVYRDVEVAVRNNFTAMYKCIRSYSCID